MSSPSKQTKFDKLLEEIKNSKYEIKEIGEIATGLFSGNSSITKASGGEGQYSAIVCSDIFESNVYLDECKIFIDQEIKINQPFIENGDIVIARSGYTKKNKYGCRLFLGDSKALAGNNIYHLKHNQNSKYLISTLSTDAFNEQVNSCLKTSLSSMMTLDLTKLKKFKIPLPSLELQEKIGNFLSTFSDYDKKLKKEVELRRKQLKHFKEEIFGNVNEKCGMRNVE